MFLLATSSYIGKVGKKWVKNFGKAKVKLEFDSSFPIRTEPMLIVKLYSQKKSEFDV